MTRPTRPAGPPYPGDEEPADGAQPRFIPHDTGPQGRDQVASAGVPAAVRRPGTAAATAPYPDAPSTRLPGTPPPPGVPAASGARVPGGRAGAAVPARCRPQRGAATGPSFTRIRRPPRIPAPRTPTPPRPAGQGRRATGRGTGRPRQAAADVHAARGVCAVRRPGAPRPGADGIPAAGARGLPAAVLPAVRLPAGAAPAGAAVRARRARHDARCPGQPHPGPRARRRPGPAHRAAAACRGHLAQPRQVEQGDGARHAGLPGDRVPAHVRVRVRARPSTPPPTPTTRPTRCPTPSTT